MTKDSGAGGAVQTAHLSLPGNDCLIVPMRAFEDRIAFRGFFEAIARSTPEALARNEGWCTRARRLFRLELDRLVIGEPSAIALLVEELPAAVFLPEIRDALHAAASAPTPAVFAAVAKRLAKARPVAPTDGDDAWDFLSWARGELSREPTLDGVSLTRYLCRHTGAVDPTSGLTKADKRAAAILKTLQRRAKRTPGVVLTTRCLRHPPHAPPYAFYEVDELPPFSALVGLSPNGFVALVELERLLREGGLTDAERASLLAGADAHVRAQHAAERREARRKRDANRDGLERLVEASFGYVDLAEGLAESLREAVEHLAGRGKGRG